ncbi:hypothetical protein POSPLADRAFT_1045632 [Postia placenta MAD-698-R-SB12]|uniref:CxC5 like cysteine cluster associated with KDZ domain-containing protein n=1 Tax=Postia placenta MAD-698-R-SB12 TaxID=670580 RepID=A0A1X6N482_9APHY|nr:hypothetical protein POSPLADRAFT_1045632 [Postia placenta MAD-698-R-SB12]OSX63252.1 hypothetical protein POSPLADRAFT_1045632 [Postia placenta MAD-698-R-SB12]
MSKFVLALCALVVLHGAAALPVANNGLARRVPVGGEVYIVSDDLFDKRTGGEAYITNPDFDKRTGGEAYTTNSELNEKRTGGEAYIVSGDDAILREPYEDIRCGVDELALLRMLHEISLVGRGSRGSDVHIVTLGVFEKPTGDEADVSTNEGPRSTLIVWEALTHECGKSSMLDKMMRSLAPVAGHDCRRNSARQVAQAQWIMDLRLVNVVVGDSSLHIVQVGIHCLFQRTAINIVMLFVTRRQMVYARSACHCFATRASEFTHFLNYRRESKHLKARGVTVMAALVLTIRILMIHRAPPWTYEWIYHIVVTKRRIPFDSFNTMSSPYTNSQLHSASRPRTLRGKRGGLKEFLNVPLDIGFEQRLEENVDDPKIIFNMARRETQCGGTAGLSALSQRTPNCLKKNAKIVLWKFSVRYCGPCREALTVPGTHSKWLRVSSQPLWEHREDWLCGIKRFYMPVLYHIPELRRVELEYGRIVGDVNALQRFSERQTTQVKLIDEYAKKMEAWEKERDTQRAQVLNEIRSRPDLCCYLWKCHSLMYKAKPLSELGKVFLFSDWQKIYDMVKSEADRRKTVSTSRLPSVPFASSLSDDFYASLNDTTFDISDWLASEYDTCAQGLSSSSVANVVDNDVSSYLQNTASDFKVLLRVLADTLVSQASNLDTFPDVVRPSLADLALTQHVRDMICSGEDEVADIQTMRDCVPSAVAYWIRSVRHRLQDILWSGMGTADLDLAMAFFECTGCMALLSYPDVVAHSCTRSPRSYSIFPAKRSQLDEYEEAVYAVDDAAAWSSDCLRIASSHSRIRHVIEVCGYYPDTAIRRHLDAGDVKLAYNLPEVPEDVRIVMMEHERKLSGLQPLHWKSSQAQPEATAKKGDEDDSTLVGYWEQQYWCCSLCHDPDGYCRDVHAIKEHIQKRYLLSQSWHRVY